MSDGPDSSDSDLVTQFVRADSGVLLFIREVLSSALAVGLVGLILFAVAGVWPPMVAVESQSMEPHLERGDLVFITEPERFSPSYAVGDTGIVTTSIGKEHGYHTFGGFGSVIVYQTPERASLGLSPIIHRARLYVEKGENWYDRANPEYLKGDSCEAIAYCPAPYSGFITKGDNNHFYDQANGIAPIVKAKWIRGVARVKIPYLGYVRLIFSGVLTGTPVPVDVAFITHPSELSDAALSDAALSDASSVQESPPTRRLPRRSPGISPSVSETGLNRGSA